MFAEEWLLQITFATIALLGKPTYKVRVQLGINSKQLRRHICLLDIGSGLKIARITFRQKKWSIRIRYQAVPKLGFAIKEPIQLLGRILLSERISDLHVKVRFGIVKHLAVDVLLGTRFID